VDTGGAGTSWALSAASAVSSDVAPAMPLGDPALDAAVRYFGAHGLRSTALDDVARSGDLDLRELSRRYPTSRSLALGVFERMLEILGEQLEEQNKRGATLTERLQRWFELELQLLEPCKALVRSWLLESVNPLSPAALLQGPLAFRYSAQIQRELERARGRREISGWILPVVAAGAFIGLRRSLVLGWLADDSPAAARTLPLARAEIAAFVQLLAPWPGLDQARPSQSRSSSAHEPRALPAPSDVAVETVAQAAVVQTEAVPAAAVNTALAQAPAVLGTLAQAALTPDLPLSPVPEEASPPEPARLDNSSPAPVKPGSETSATRAKRRARAKRSRH
jgi:AcrR family transcriptional regulator